MHQTKFVGPARKIATVVLLGLVAGCTGSPPIHTASEPAEQAIRVSEHQARVAPTPVARALADTASQNLATPEQAAPPPFWSQMRAGFVIREIASPQLETELQWLRDNPAYVARVLRRAAPVLPFILQETQSRGLPTELALLPFVESAFTPTARSRSGAAGLWQFMPATGRQYGLHQDWWADDRRDLVRATRAALDYLAYLNKRVDGDWPLALAAYNAGIGTVYKAQARNRRAGLETNFEALRLRRETRHYVPKLVAISRLIAQPATFNQQLPQVSLQPSFELVETQGQIELALAAKLAGIETSTLEGLNPALHRWATRPNGPHHLLVPGSQAELLRVGIATLDPEQRVRWQRHPIARGDSLSTIAQRYGTTARVLKQSNGLRSSAIRAGEHLLVPWGQTTTLNAAAANCDSSAAQYQVAAGDTLWMLSQRHQVSLSLLQQCNHLADHAILSIGQTLQMPRGTLQLAGGTGQSTEMVEYRIRKGDSLSRVSRKFGVSINQLRQWNDLTGNLLRTGDLLKVRPNTI